MTAILWRVGWWPSGFLPYSMIIEGWRYVGLGPIRWPVISLIVRGTREG